MSQFHTDSPITGRVDSPDLLGREEFAKRIGGGLLLSEGAPGIVVSIEGEWGYGKTSFINLMNNYFQSLPLEKQPITFGFCPWMISGVENLVQEFLVQLASTIGLSSSASEAKNVARQLVSYSKVFSALKFVPGAEPWASIVQGVMGSVGEAASSIGKLKELNIEGRRDKVAEALGKLKKPIVVFIDDIDKIPPDEIYDIIRLVKAVADFPRVAFVLALDSSYVVDSLHKFGIDNGDNYLNKIIQSRINLPIVSTKDIEKLVNDELALLPEEARQVYFPENKSRLGLFYQGSIKYLLTSPRDVKRLFDRIKLIEPTIRGEVEFADLFALEVVGIKAPAVYEHIKELPGAYTGVPPGASFLIEKPADYVAKYAEVREKKLGELPDSIASSMRVLLEELFPLLSELRHSHNQNYCRQHGWIAASDRLLAIHSYGLPKGEVSIEVTSAFLTCPEKRTTIIEQVLNEEDIDAFVDGLNLNVGDIKPARPEDFVAHLSNLIDTRFVYQMILRPTGFIGVDLDRKIWWILKKYISSLDKESRFNLLSQLLTNPEKLTLGTHGVIHSLRQFGYFGTDGEVGEEQRWCTDEEMTQIKAQWIEAVKNSFEGNHYCLLTGKRDILFLLCKIDLTLAKDLYRPFIERNDGLDCIAKSLCYIGEDTHNGQNVHVRKETLEDLFGLDEIREKVAARLDVDEEMPSHIKATYLSILSGKPIYLVGSLRRG